MKIFCHIPRENWIIDRIGQEYMTATKHETSCTDLTGCDVIWLLGSWCWRQIPQQLLASKPVVCMLHHEVPEKFVGQRLADFLQRDQFVDAYNVPCDQTKDFISQYTKKPVHKLGYWINRKLWYPDDRAKCREEFGAKSNEFVVGSFQRDTEGSDLKTPKLEKGPDIFCDTVERLEHPMDSTHVFLNAWRRQYVMKRLDQAGIKYTYKELPPIDVVRRMYAALDLYIVSSRYEGGPQAIIEAAIMKVPIVSTDCGIAKDILHPNCVQSHDDLAKHFPTNDEVEYAYERALEYDIEKRVKVFDKFFEELV